MATIRDAPIAIFLISESFSHSTDSFKRLIHSETRQVIAFMNGLLNH